MIGSALLWYDPQFKISSPDPFRPRTSSSGGRDCSGRSSAREDRHAIFDSLGLTEPLSEIYEPFRWGSILGVRLLAVRSPQSLGGVAQNLLDLSAQYSAVVSGLLALGGVSWTDPGYKGSAGFWYDGPTFSPVSERSEAPGLQSDPGPALLPRDRLAPDRLQAGDLGRTGRAAGAQGIAGRARKGSGFDAAAALLRGGPVDAVINGLAGVGLSTEQHWMSWPEGLLAYKPARRTPIRLASSGRGPTTASSRWPSAGPGVRAAIGRTRSPALLHSGQSDRGHPAAERRDLRARDPDQHADLPRHGRPGRSAQV